MEADSGAAPADRPLSRAGGAMVGVRVSPEIELSTPQAVSPKIVKRVQATGDHRSLAGNFKGILSLGFLPYVAKEGRAEPASLRPVY